MLRLKKLRRQRDPTSTSATKFVAQRTSERHRRSVETMDERSRPTAGRCRTGGECVRCTRKATSEEPDAWAHANTGGSGASAADLEARTELEQRHAGARSSRGEERRVERYRELVSLTRKIVHQAEGVLEEMQHLPRCRQTQLKRLREILETMAGRVRQMVRQTKARVFQGIIQYPHKIVSLFEPHTEIIRKGKASKPNEFGKVVKVQEAENQIVTHYEVFAERP